MGTVLKAVTVIGLVAALAALSATAYAEEKGEKVTLPAAAAEAVKKALPDATLSEVKVEDKDGLKVYEAGLKQGGKEMEVEVTEDGTIIELSAEIAVADLPKAVADAVAKAAPGAEVKEAKKEETRATVEKGKVVKLEAAKVTYAVEVVKDGKETEIELAADGTVIKTKEAGKEENEEKGEKGAKDEG